MQNIKRRNSGRNWRGEDGYWENRGGWCMLGCWLAYIVAYVYQQSHFVIIWHQHCSSASCWPSCRNQQSVILTFVFLALGYQQQESLFCWMLLLLLVWVVLLLWVPWLSAILVSQESICDSYMCLYLFSDRLKLLEHCVILHVLHVSAILAIIRWMLQQTWQHMPRCMRVMSHVWLQSLLCFT